MSPRERRKAYLTIVLSMILGIVCFALAGAFFTAAFAQEVTPELSSAQVFFQENRVDVAHFER